MLFPVLARSASSSQGCYSFQAGLRAFITRSGGIMTSSGQIHPKDEPVEPIQNKE
jgi:hypothetical protein